MKQEYHTVGTCPELLDVGREPLAVVWKKNEPTVYSDGLKLKIVVPNDLEFIETVRVRDGIVEYQFSCKDIESEWSSGRSKAFQDCVLKSKTTLPSQRSVIFGPSHGLIQQEILKHFPNALSLPTKGSATKKRLSWGDESTKVVEEPNGEHRYGGWGLAAIKVIPNRYELRLASASWADLVLDSDDFDEYFDMDEDRNALIERELQSFSLFDDEYRPLDSEEDLPSNRNIDDDEKTVFVTPSSLEDEVEEEFYDAHSDHAKESKVVNISEMPPLEDNTEDTTDEDEEDEIPAASENLSRKRIRIEPLTNLDETSPIKVARVSPTNLSCKPIEDGLKESDFWLLQDEQPSF